MRCPAEMMRRAAGLAERTAEEWDAGDSETHDSGEVAEPARAWRDRHGDVWTYDDGDGLMHSFETAPFPREHVEKKWGPLVPEPHDSGREDER
jgi:hypothetical protein